MLVLVRAGSLAVIGGVALALLNEERSPNPASNSIKGAPYVLPLIIILMLVWTIVLSKTPFGRYIYAVGGNAEAARRAGIDLQRMRIAAFAIGSGMAALARCRAGVQARLGSVRRGRRATPCCMPWLPRSSVARRCSADEVGPATPSSAVSSSP